MKEDQVSIKDKYCLTIEESAAYFNIGDKKLRKIITENPKANFILQNGIKYLIKRRQFEEYLENLTSI